MTPPPTSSDPFASVPPELASAMQARGFAELTLVQRAVVDADLAGRDLRLSSQTGSGKTVAIGLLLGRELIALSAQRAEGTRPRGPSALIIAPTRELASQVADELRWLYAGLRGIRVEVVTGGTSLELDRRMLARGPVVLVGTPGRLLDHLRTGALDGSGLQHVVLDEADQMLDLGFREELEAILAELPKERRSHLVSATFPRAVVRLAEHFQHDAVQLQGTQLGAAHEDIEHVVHLVNARDVYAGLVNLLLAMQGELTLVFVRRRTEASELAEQLTADGFTAAPFSGELPQAQRTRTLNAFRSRAIEILISTDVAARGIDVPDISAVVHVALPEDADIYTHRSGRTGRAGRKGRSLLLVPVSHQRRVERILDDARVRRSWRPLPSAKTVRRLQAERARRALEAGLAQGPPPDEAQLAQARLILDSPEPLLAVAALVRMAAPRPAREPLELGPIEPARARTERGGADFVRFAINYGKRSGATPDRVMAHVCRRGKIKRHSIGAIRIEHDSASFEVASDAAEAFHANTRRPDAREPLLRIFRERGSADRGAPHRPVPDGGRGSRNGGRSSRPGPHPAGTRTSKPRPQAERPRGGGPDSR